ncbi:MAG TPA: MFS transporter [Peptococcaceae bacterium]|nr:MFS transporter [Peptococcaceae bacterium]
MVSNQRSFYLLLAGTFFIFLNFNIAQVITPVYILAIGGSEFVSGLQSTLFYLTAVVLRFYFGPLADAKGNRITLFIGGLAFMTAPLLFLFSQSLWYVLLVRMYQAIGLAAYFSSASAVVSALAPRGKVGAYIGFYRLVTMSTLLVGPTLALKVLNSFGYTWYHLLGIAIGFLAMAFLHFVKEPPKTENHAALVPDAPVAAAPAASAPAAVDPVIKPGLGMLSLLKDKKLIPIFQSIFLVSICYGLVQTFSAIYVEQAAPHINSGLFFTVFGIGSIISSLISGTLSDRKGRAEVVFPWIMIMGTGLALLYFLPLQSWLLYFGSFLSGFGYAGSIAVLISWVVDVVPISRRTTALALEDSTIDIGIGLGSFFFGVLIPLLGLPWSYAASGLLLLVFAGWKITTMIVGKRKPLPLG